MAKEKKTLNGLVDHNTMLIVGEFKEIDETDIITNKHGDITSYEIIEVDGAGVSFDKNNIICQEFIELEPVVQSQDMEEGATND